MPDGQQVGEGEQGHQADDQAAHEIRDHHEPQAGEEVNKDASEEQKGQHGDGGEHKDGAHGHC